MNILGRIIVVLSLFALVRCTPPAPTEPPDTREADEAAIRADEADWSAAGEAKNIDEFVSFYAQDGTLMLEGAADLHGPQAIREAMEGMMEDPNFALSFQPDNVVVARSGDLAYDTGTYELTLSGPDGEPSTQNGHYVVVWQKGADGSWKVVVDAPVSDPAASTM